jgi:hypothetical protein
VHKKASLILAVGIMMLSGYGVVAASAWPWKAALFPLAIGIPLFCLASAEALWLLFGSTENAQTMDFQRSAELPAKESARRTGVAVAWMLGFFAAIVLLGFPVAVPLFVFLYLRVQGGEAWLLTIAMTAAAWGIFYGLFDLLLHLPLPTGWLLAWLGFSS